jgi:Leucine-rich repeat (LRR) protein
LSVLLVAVMVVYLVVPAVQIRAAEEPEGPVWPQDASIVAEEVTASSVALTWTPAISAAGIDRYEIFINGSAQPNSVTGEANAEIGGLSPETAYEFSIEAVDVDGRRSEPLMLPVTTLAMPNFDPGLEAAIREELGNYQGDLAFAPLDTITRLDAEDASISSLEGIGLLTSLRYLYLSGNNLEDEDLAELSGLADLKELDLSNNNLTSLSQLSGLASLYYLDASGNAITDLTGIGALNSLRILDLSLNPIADFGDLDELQSLNTLNLLDTRMDDGDLQTVAGMLPNLETLIISFNEISDLSPLNAMKRLDYLNASFNRIADLSPLQTMIEDIEAESSYLTFWLQYNPLDMSPDSEVWDTIDAMEAAASAKDLLLDIRLPELYYGYRSDWIWLAWEPAYWDDLGIEYYAEVNGEDYPAYTLPYTEGLISLDLHGLEPGGSYEIRIYAVKGDVEYDYNSTTYRFALPELIENVYIPDPTLKNLILSALEKEPGEPISSDDMLNLSYLDASDIQGCVYDLTGLEYAKNLYDLDLSGHCVYDLSPLEGLELDYLNLGGNRLSNVDFFDEAGNYTNIVNPKSRYNPFIDLTGNYLDLSQGSEDQQLLQQLEGLGITVYADEQRADDLVWVDANKLTVERLTSSSVTLSWAPVAGAIGYVLYMNNDAVDYTEETSVTVGDLTPSAKYTFKVEAVDEFERETVSGPHRTVVIPEPDPFRITVKTDKDVYLPGETVVAEIYADLADIYSFDLSIEYDTAAFTLTDIALHSDFAAMSEEPQLNYYNQQGWLSILGFLTGEVSGPGLGEDERAGLLTLTFTANETAASSAEIRVLEGSQAMTSDLRPYYLMEDATASAKVVIPIEGIELKTDDSRFVDGELWLETNPGSQRRSYAYSDTAGNISYTNNPSNTELIWTSSDENVVTVEDGVITAVGNGTATVTAQAKYGGASASVTVHVETRLEGIEIDWSDEQDLYLSKGGQQQLTFTIQPLDPAPEGITITWLSSDESVVTVQNGLLTGVGTGTAEITVTAVQTPRTGSPMQAVTLSDTIMVVVYETTELSMTVDLPIADLDERIIVTIAKPDDGFAYNGFLMQLAYDSTALTLIGAYSMVEGIQLTTDEVDGILRIGGMTEASVFEDPNLVSLMFEPTGKLGKTTLQLLGAMVVRLAGGKVYLMTEPQSLTIAVADTDVFKEDGGFGLADVTWVAQQYGKTGSGLSGDFNYDGKIDIVDIAHIVRRYMLKKIPV